MPIYEYRRPDGTTFELQQSFSEDRLTVDPDTGVPVERVLHPPAVHFKGKGFYSTDYGTRKRERETVAAAAGSAEGSANGAGPDKPGRGKEGAAATASHKSEAPAGKPDGASAVSGKP
jgi:predicted nucleic acid-binding Zn ribbon protein